MSEPLSPQHKIHPQKKLAAVIMAAGQGKRMQDPAIPKVLYPLAGKPLLSYVLSLTEALHADETIVIIGYGREKVAAYLKENWPAVKTAIQEPQLGTGHAIMQAEAALEGFTGSVLVLSGDVPLLSVPTAQRLLDTHHKSNALATVLTVRLENPFGYGRVVRTTNGNALTKIVEERDADETTKKIHEINSGIYVFDAKALFVSLKSLKPENAQHEYYLTDVFPSIIANNRPDCIAIETTNDPTEVAGVNTKEQLQTLETLMVATALSKN